MKCWNLEAVSPPQCFSCIVFAWDKPLWQCHQSQFWYAISAFMFLSQYSHSCRWVTGFISSLLHPSDRKVLCTMLPYCCQTDPLLWNKKYLNDLDVWVSFKVHQCQWLFALSVQSFSSFWCREQFEDWFYRDVCNWIGSSWISVNYKTNVREKLVRVNKVVDRFVLFGKWKKIQKRNVSQISAEYKIQRLLRLWPSMLWYYTVLWTPSWLKSDTSAWMMEAMFAHKTTWQFRTKKSSEFYQIMRRILWNRVIPKQYKSICKVYIKLILTYSGEIWTLVKKMETEGAEENIWTQEGCNSNRLEKMSQWGDL